VQEAKGVHIMQNENENQNEVRNEIEKSNTGKKEGIDSFKSRFAVVFPHWRR